MDEQDIFEAAAKAFQRIFDADKVSGTCKEQAEYFLDRAKNYGVKI